ncbi:MAG: divergent PAP2 family protein [Faecalibacterium sp.]|nr:divergent PAP2 family protein [Faecalibacterium sp.]
MDIIHAILNWNYILTVSVTAWLVAQVLKTIINFALVGRLQISRMWGDGGMPSAHSATVCAMVVASGFHSGTDSTTFGIACVVAIITMHDAMGVRYETGEQAKVLNQMIQEWMEIGSKNAPFLNNRELKEMVGHTPFEVIGGAIVGLLIGLLFTVL